MRNPYSPGPRPAPPGPPPRSQTAVRLVTETVETWDGRVLGVYRYRTECGPAGLVAHEIRPWAARCEYCGSYGQQFQCVNCGAPVRP